MYHTIMTQKILYYNVIKMYQFITIGDIEKCSYIKTIKHKLYEKCLG